MALTRGILSYYSIKGWRSFSFAASIIFREKIDLFSNLFLTLIFGPFDSHLSPGKAGGLNKTVNRSKRIENHEPPEGSAYSNIFN
jgi:hypothetical protein